jgi:hypothetical protein
VGSVDEIIAEQKKWYDPENITKRAARPMTAR